MESYLKNGYATKLNTKLYNENNEIINYIPHHGVKNVNKPGKIRVVFDAGAKINSTSLNQNLLKEPGYLSNLISILIKFRKEKFAVMEDINTFHLIFLSPKDRDALRFVWRKFLTDPIEDYRMSVLIFGKIDSCIANWVVKKTAKDQTKSYSERAIESILEHFYMDDFLDLFSSQTEAINTWREISETLNKGGFHLTKFVSNDREILKPLPQSVNLDLEKISLERALGMLWNPHNDTIKVKAAMKPFPPSTRSLLSFIFSVFDRLGLSTLSINLQARSKIKLEAPSS